MPESKNRERIAAWVKFCGWICAAAVIYIIVDFSFDLRPPGVHSSYQFSLDPLADDQVVFLQQDNLVVVVVRRSPATIAALRKSRDELQDYDSRSSHQPDYARNRLRSRHAEYFVGLGIGTHLGCRLRAKDDLLAEICSEARYDFAGRALQGSGNYRNLDVPEYSFSNNFNTLTIVP